MMLIDGSKLTLVLLLFSISSTFIIPMSLRKKVVNTFKKISFKKSKKANTSEEQEEPEEQSRLQPVVQQQHQHKVDHAIVWLRENVLVDQSMEIKSQTLYDLYKNEHTNNDAMLLKREFDEVVIQLFPNAKFINKGRRGNAGYVIEGITRQL
ncbi:hypothetical protein BDC45DRAFT_553080 [Circinella umbellata]|nr:hypothetical protein BDC45DRAFT_553080 [Circinella umbellata]